MKFIGCLLLEFLLYLDFAQAIVVRHDVSASKYIISETELPALAELPDEGPGILIANRWVVTAAHAVTGRPIQQVRIKGHVYPVLKVIVNPGYTTPPSKLERGNAAPLMEFKANSDDIALIKLEYPVSSVKPAVMYRDSREKGEIAEILGRGATGDGLVGQYPKSPHRGELRRAYSRVINADERWLVLRLEAPPTALPLEGSPSDGDSGGPLLIEVNHIWQLAGLVSHKYATGDLSSYSFSRYGQLTYQVRISHYISWIEATTKGQA